LSHLLPGDAVLHAPSQGLVAARQEGRRRLYLVRPEGLATLEEFLAELWPAHLERLKQTVESERGG
jgi:hypothetical protein